MIPITDRPHLPSNIRLWWGDSRAKWEGDTLVVDVTNFSPKTDFQGSRENLHLVERYTRKDANTLEYQVTMEDPTTWVRSWTVTQEYTQAAGQGQPPLQGAALPRRQSRHAGAAGRRARRRARLRERDADRIRATLCSAGCGGFAGGFADDGEEVNPFTR